MQDRFETFTVLINKISRNIRKIKNQEMEAYNLRSAHVSCLYYLYKEQDLTATELCERCAEDKATISRALDYLEQNAYLVSAPKAAKKYKSPITLTDKGVETGKIISDKIDAVLLDISSSLTESERVAFYQSLSIICDRLEHICENKDSHEYIGQ